MGVYDNSNSTTPPQTSIHSTDCCRLTWSRVLARGLSRTEDMSAIMWDREKKRRNWEQAEGSYCN